MSELVKIKSNNPDHPKGYYMQFKDKMKPDDEIYTGEEKKVEAKIEAPIETPESKKTKRGKK